MEGLGTVKTAAQFASGEVAYLLGDAFGQTIGTEDHPVLGGKKVYLVPGSCAEDAEMVYSNDPDRPDHVYDPVTGKCANCDAIQLIAYDLWVGDTQVTSLNAANVFGDGTVSYDAKENALTLKDYTYESAGYNDAAIYYGGSGTLELVLVNDSTVTHVGNSNLSYGIYANNGSITISGSGSLTGTGGTVTGDSGFSYGIYASGSITISGTGSLTGTGGEAPSGQSCSYGIYVSGGDLTISGSTVTANGGSASGSSYGVCADSIEVTGGSLTGNSGAAGEFSYGVTAGSIKVMGGSLTGSGDEADFSSYGVYANNGGIEVTGGSLTGTGDLYGVYAYNLTLGEGIGILTPVGGRFDADKCAVVDAAGKIAKEVKIAEMPDPVKVQLELTKEFNGWDNADGFTFNLAAVTENAPMPASPSATATEEKPLACFGEITYTAEGTYEYTITEVDSGIPGVTYDTSAHEVVVTIENTEDNKLIAEVKYDGKESLIITNAYTEATLYNLWIGGTQVTSHNAADVFGDGTVSYDADSNTLTLHSYTYEGPGYTWDNSFGSSYGAAIYYGDTEPLNLILKGDSTVTHTGNENLYRSYGLYANGNVVVNADSLDDSLTITGGAATYGSYGVCLAYDYENSVGGELTLNSGSLIATGGEVSRDYYISYGLHIGRSTVINGGSIIAKAKEQTNKTVKRSGMVYGESITFAGGFGILTPVGGKISYGDILDSSDEVADYVEIGAGYTVTAAFDSVDEKNVGGTVSGAGFYAECAEVTLTITPDTGCELKSVTAVSDGSTVNGTLSGSTYTFTMPENDVAVTVTLERLFTPYDLWVGGERFTDKKLTISDGKGGTATYDYASNTLTLDGYTYAGAGHTWDDAFGSPCSAAIYYGSTQTLKLVLKGDSTVTHTGGSLYYSYGLYAKGNVVVSEGSAGGSLTATGGTAENDSYGVCANGSIEVSGSLTATGGTAKYRSYGVHATGSITVPGSLTATGGTPSGRA